MDDLVKNLLESHSSSFNDAVEAIFNTLFESSGPVPVNSHDAVDMLAQKVGENVHKTDDGANIVGLAAQAGLGDHPLPTEEDKISNSINNDAAKDVTIPSLPTEEDIPGLPTGSIMDDGVGEDDIGGDMPDDNIFDDSEPFEDVSDNPPPDDFELPEISMDTEDGDDHETDM
jgi:hypothetical protein